MSWQNRYQEQVAKKYLREPGTRRYLTPPPLYLNTPLIDFPNKEVQIRNTASPLFPSSVSEIDDSALEYIKFKNYWPNMASSNLSIRIFQMFELGLYNGGIYKTHFIFHFPLLRSTATKNYERFVRPILQMKIISIFATGVTNLSSMTSFIAR